MLKWRSPIGKKYKNPRTPNTLLWRGQSADKTWLIGAATNENARELAIPLSFLKSGKYQAMIIQDGNDADYRTNNESYKISLLSVSRTDSIHVKLAHGGGACIMIKQ